MSSKSKSEKTIKAKVFVGFGLMLVLVVFLAFITLRSFQNLTHSADQLAQPNKNIIMLHDIIFSIYQAESHIRTYTLTQNEAYLNVYFEELEVIDELVDSLYLLSEQDAYFSEHIDSINVLLNQKVALLEEFIELKSGDKNSVFYELVISKIIKVADDNNQDNIAEELANEEALLAEENLPEVEESEQPEPEEGKSNFFRRVRNFFSGSSAESELADHEEEFIEEEQMDTMDLDFAQSSDTYDLKENIEAILNNVKRMAMQHQREVSKRENELLLEDKSTMDQIWYFITLLENYESQKASVQADESHQTVKSSSRTIFTIIVLCFLILVVFSWMISYDIARSRFYKKQLIAQKERAESLVKLKQRFMASMSHEVRTPLAAIIGFTKQIQRTPQNSEQQFISEAIQKSSNHLLGIVNDILDFSKIEAGKLVLEDIPLDIKELAIDVHRTLDVLARDKNLDFTLDFNGLNNSCIYGDPLRLRQILINLAGNALKFTETGYVKMGVSDQEQPDDPDTVFLHMKIEDSGPGISPEKQKEIFEEFSQADDQTTRKHGGTGLGLSISNRLVELMNGSISLYSEVGKGALFEVRIAVRKMKEPDIIDNQSSPQVQDFVKNIGILNGISNDADIVMSEPDCGENNYEYNVLLVEDKYANQMVISMMLKEAGCKVDMASNGAIALEKIVPGKYDLIFMDIQMPVMDGVVTLKELRKLYSPQQLPYIVGLSGKAMKEDKEYFLSIGMDDYITKPLSNEVLHLCLKNWEAKANRELGN